MYNGSRAMLRTRLGPTFGGWHSYSPHPRYRFLILDAYEIAIIGISEGDANYAKAHAVLQANNPQVFTSNDWLSGIDGIQRRFVPYNGGMSPMQLEWLERELCTAVQERGELVVVFSHISVQPGANASSCLVWNFEDVTQRLQRFAASKFNGKAGVVAVFAGHAHEGGYAIDEAGIHHVTLASPLEAEDCLAHAVLLVREGELSLRGAGAIPHRRLVAFANEEQAKCARREFCQGVIDQLFALCQQRGFAHRTRHECAQILEEFKYAWDALPAEHWPRLS